jgi:hypothetical protein
MYEDWLITIWTSILSISHWYIDIVFLFKQILLIDLIIYQEMLNSISLWFWQNYLKSVTTVIHARFVLKKENNREWECWYCLEFVWVCVYITSWAPSECFQNGVARKLSYRLLLKPFKTFFTEHPQAIMAEKYFLK